MTTTLSVRMHCCEEAEVSVVGYPRRLSDDRDFVVVYLEGTSGNEIKLFFSHPARIVEFADFLRREADQLVESGGFPELQGILERHGTHQEEGK